MIPRHLSSILGLALLSSQAAVAQDARDPSVARPHQHASSPAAMESPLAVPLDAATLASLPRETVTSALRGSRVPCEGVAVATLLRSAGVSGPSGLRAADLARYVVVAGRDGHRVVFSLGELEPSLGNHQVFLVDRCQGRPLDESDGPLKLIAPTEQQDARWMPRVQSITVVAAP